MRDTRRETRELGQGVVEVKMRYWVRGTRYETPDKKMYIEGRYEKKIETGFVFEFGI
jgi:hypothetical protein